MTKYEQIKEDLKSAMKSGEKDKTGVLRFLLADIKNEAVNSNADRENIPDDVTMKVLEKAAKSRKDAITVYDQQGRTDLAEPERKELQILQSYLPAQLSDAELQNIVQKVKAENPSMQGMALMGKIMPLVKGKADPDRIKSLL
ncbi:MAG: GatB/YqeY domain-containing protein [Candidatus Dojkabacteria bacterium]